MKRGSGVLLHISSLPGPFGVGCFGAEAREFARMLSDAGVSYWQVLPFSVPGDSDSPYMSISAFAGNPMLICPDELVEKGWLTEEERLELEHRGDVLQADFESCRRKRAIFLRKAFGRISDETREEVKRFIDAHEWVQDLSLFLMIRGMNGEKPWWEWSDEDLRRHDTYSLAAIRERYYDEFLYFAFVQYLFFSQWARLKKEINDLGISVIGDIPIYVSKDSVDVWAHRNLFRIDGHLKFLNVAGVPPDYFSAKGQLWGNPLYDWEAHADEDYHWWRSRLAGNFEIYDLLRIDHFRGFSSYWSVPADREDAIVGTWETGPGQVFFDRLKLDFPDPPIFAEDLGEATEDLQLFLESTGFPGMRVFQFGFDDEEDNKHRPHNFSHSCVAYSGTHDNDTSVGWYESLSEESKEAVRDYCGLDIYDGVNFGPEGLCKGIMRSVMQSHADLVIFPVQDLLYMNSSRRMNIPGTQSGNWGVRFLSEELAKADIHWLMKINRLTGRI
ncbi:MAG: 4-alpha-glucanotransferase [Clostridiaceae bacterium]|jgi:4-alpha-glucanotransferase|nr:4-alpha-glucanotransferase [Clostridiaceae bacterium]